jgi:hypothetical protein
LVSDSVYSEWEGSMRSTFVRELRVERRKHYAVFNLYFIGIAIAAAFLAHGLRDVFEVLAHAAVAVTR